MDAWGSALTYDGSSWSLPDSIDAYAGEMTSVSCPTASFCAAVDYGGNVLIYDGSSWSPPDSIDSAVAPDLRLLPDGDLLCRGRRGRATFSPTTAARGRRPSSIDGENTLTSVSCPTASFCGAVDEVGNVLTYNGSSWSSPEDVDAANGLDPSLLSDIQLLRRG